MQIGAYMLNETFTTHITFTSGDSHKEEPITGDKLVSTITRLSLIHISEPTRLV